MQTTTDHTLVGRSRRLISILLAVGPCFVLQVTAPRAADNIFALVCAEQEVKAITSLEDHGIANDVPADQLGAAGLMMWQARETCYAGKVDEALALYQRVIDLESYVAAKQ
jgi:hypothetical protein